MRAQEMSAPPRSEARGLGGSVMRWAAALTQLDCSTPHLLPADTAERLAFSLLALRAGRALKAGSREAERSDLLLLALVNVRAAVLCLNASLSATSAADPASGADSAEPVDLDLNAL